jgi:hypothetical protein
MNNIHHKVPLASRAETITGEALTSAEVAALRGYKDNSEGLNIALRKREDLRPWTSDVNLLDSALSKRRATRPLRLFRATSKEFVPEPDCNNEFVDLGYASTSLTNRERGTHFRHSTENPLLLVVDCPKGARMAFLEFGDSGQSEDEILLPRSSRFQVWATKTIAFEQKMRRATRANRFYTQNWKMLHVYYAHLLIR